MTFSDFWYQGLLGCYFADFEGTAFDIFMFFAGYIVCIIGGYLLGSINAAIIISKYRYKRDIRDSGSGNAGTTNMLRTYGGDAAKWTLIGDIAKTVAAYLLGTILFGIRGAWFSCTMCIIGHCFPIFYKFKGGKGMVCVGVTVLLLDPVAFGILFPIFVIILVGMKYMSLASIMGMLFYPLVHQLVMVYQPNRYWPMSTFFAVIISLLVIWRHYPNMKRLMDKKESKTDLVAKMIKGDDPDGKRQRRLERLIMFICVCVAILVFVLAVFVNYKKTESSVSDDTSEQTEAAAESSGGDTDANTGVTNEYVTDEDTGNE
ncbi:MAG: glycerol-3-phosphate 1-O-acyltransferase PlsY [Firmicutes bacterium]|nr:glycerol-3-phosphate 1-O-acyltransferase PlsY [Bacillota bacterium]MCD8314534.1 glycerol-3-phosphate 1-O-acyltransferase PlsY [Bacillota bacterium]